MQSHRPGKPVDLREASDAFARRILARCCLPLATTSCARSSMRRRRTVVSSRDMHGLRTGKDCAARSQRGFEKTIIALR
jgi:hypothetical protein